MADAPINRVWVSIDTGSQNFGPKRSFFAGGDSVDEVVAHLTDMVGAEAAGNLVSVFTQVAMLDAPDVQAIGELRSQGLIKQNQPAADPSAPVCNHGVMVYKTGTSAKGPWKAWFCPAPKGDPSQCKAKFL